MSFQTRSKGGYKIADTLANITAGAESLVHGAVDVTITDLGDDGITVKGNIDNYVDGSDTGFVSAAGDLTKPWETDSNDLLVATNDESVINLDSLKGKLDWTWTSGNEFGDKEFTGTIAAGKFNNILEGGKGDDTLVGLDGAKDVFLFNSWCRDNFGGGKQLGHDTIYNFEVGQDKLMVSGVYLNGVLDMSEAVDKGFVTPLTEKDGNTTVTIKADFFNSGVPGAVTSTDLEITLVGVTGVKDAADLFVDVTDGTAGA